MNFQSKKILIIGIITICFCAFLFLPQLAIAQEDNAMDILHKAKTEGVKSDSTSGGTLTEVKTGLDKTAGKAGISTAQTGADLPAMAGRFINYFFGILGVIFLTVILIGGYQWITAGGNEEKLGKAKGWIINGINGMIVVFLAYVLVFTILAALKAAVGE
jgi:hypothetical protein